MKNIIRLTNDFIIQQSIQTLPLRLHDLECLCNSVGFELYPYDTAPGVIAKLNLTQYTKYPAFMITTEQYKIIFYDNSADTGTRLFSIAHELGHIVLKHGYQGVLGNTQADTAQEHEADVFAYQLLAPLCVLKARRITELTEIEEETLLNPDQARYVKNKLDIYDHQPGEDAILQLYRVHNRQALRSKFRIRKNVFIDVVTLCLIAVNVVMIVYAVASHYGYDLFMQPAETAAGSQLTDNVPTTTDVLASLRARMTDKQSVQTSAPQTEKAPVITDALALTTENQVSITESFASITEAASPEQGETVYVTRSGEKYHKAGCRYIKNKNTIALTISDAQADGKTPCSVCFK